MGQNNCKDLSELHDVCQLEPCIQSIESLEKKTSSQSRQFIIVFKNNTTYMQVPYQQGFAKVFFPTKKSLTNEIDIYSKVIAPLVDNNICPHFIRYLGHGTCDLKIVQNLFNDDFEELHGNHKLYSTLGQQNKKTDQMTILITETHRKLLSFHEFYQEKNSKNEFTKKLFIIIFFQLLTAIHAMEESHMNHADLHQNNFFIHKLDKLNVFAYHYNGEDFYIKTKYKVLIFDFDQSKAEQLNSDQKFLSRMDLLHFIYYTREQLVEYNILSEQDQLLQLQHVKGENDCGDAQLELDFYQGDPNRRTAIKNLAKVTPTPFELMQKCKGLFPQLVSGKRPESKSIVVHSVCDTSMFSPNGMLMMNSHKRIVRLQSKLINMGAKIKQLEHDKTNENLKTQQLQTHHNKEISDLKSRIQLLEKKKTYWKQMAVTLGVVGAGTTGAAFLHAQKPWKKQKAQQPGM